MAKIESPVKYGDKGIVHGAPATPGGKLVSPAKSTNKSEGSGHNNGLKK